MAPIDVALEAPRVSVIIPHYLGDVVSRCLGSLSRARSCVSSEEIVIDDQPYDDGSITRAVATFPHVRVARTHERHGFGAACNAGIRAARGRYLVILNNDVEVAPGWLDALVEAAEGDSTVGVLQAKIRSLHDPTRFDYSGAAGGMIDWLGFPFALGRVFDEIEVDRGQYDEPREIFWAVGSALLIRRSCLEITGLFDEAFYMHMEEMDLAWRMQLAGFRVVSCPAAVVYHHNGYTLKQGSFRKIYLNHRNNLVLLLKNMPLSRLAAILPLRIGLELATIVYGLLRRDWKHPLAAIAGILWVLTHLRDVARRRHRDRPKCAVDEDIILQKMCRRSIVIDHFVNRMSGAAINASTTVGEEQIASSASASANAQPTLLLARRRRIAGLFLIFLLSHAPASLGAQETTRGETRPGEFFTYKMPADGILLEQLVKDAESNTGKTFIYSDTAALFVKGKKVQMLGTAEVSPTPQQIFSLFQGILISQQLAITPLGDEKNGIYLIETIETPRNLKQRAPFVHESALKEYRHEIGTVIMTSIQLKHIKVDSVRNAVTAILANRNVEFTMDVPSANALIVVAFAPSVYALAQVIDAMDVPQIEATLKFELIRLEHAVPEELVPIVENLIKGDGITPQRPRPAGGEGAAFGGGERPEPKIIADPRTQSIVVYAVESDMNKIKYLVAALDADVKEPESNIRIYMLKNTNAEDLVDVLQQIIGTGTTGGSRGGRPGSNIRGSTGQGPISATEGRGQELKIVADPNNNALLITASKTRYSEILPIIQELDRRRPQVLVQAAIAELSDSDARDIGVEIAAFQGGDGYRAAGVTGFGLSTISTSGDPPNTSIIRIPFLSPGAGTAGASVTPSGGVFGIFNDDLNVPFFVALLQRTTKSNLVSMPSVLTNDNEQSTITFSKSVATQTFQTTVAGTDNTGFGGYQEAKIELIISPHISNDNYVRMEVELMVEAFVGVQISPTIPPDKTSRKLVGSVTVRSGKTVVIGGLIQDNQTNRISQVPYIGDVPIIGELFKRTEKLKEKDTLYVFITPTIFTGFEELEEVSYEKKLEIHKLCGQIKIIDPNFRPIQLDDRRVRIDCIEELGTLDIPRYAPVVPCGDCGPEAAQRPVDGVPVRPQRDPNPPVIIEPGSGLRPTTRNTR